MPPIGFALLNFLRSSFLAAVAPGGTNDFDSAPCQSWPDEAQEENCADLSVGYWRPPKRKGYKVALDIDIHTHSRVADSRGAEEFNLFSTGTPN